MIANLFDVGSNEYGSWIKYSNGILIQYGAGSSRIIQFPINFIDINYTLSMFLNIESADCFISRTSRKEKNKVHYRITANGQENTYFTAEYVAIGRWK